MCFNEVEDDVYSLKKYVYCKYILRLMVKKRLIVLRLSFEVGWRENFKIFERKKYVEKEELNLDKCIYGYFNEG